MTEGRGFAGTLAIVCQLILWSGSQALVQQAFAQNAEPKQNDTRQKVTIGYVEIEGDRRYEPIMAERLVLKARDHPFDGARIGLDDAKILSRVLKIDFELERITVKSSAEVAPAVQQATTARSIRFFIVDAPADAFKPLAEAMRGRDALLFNVTAPDDTLRRDLCAREFVHVFPSRSMSTDGLVQYLVSRKWRDFLVLQGPQPGDALAAKAFEASAQKFGARIVANKPFKVGTDPRERELNNPALLSAVSRDYDVVFVADEDFDFVRQVPFHLVKPRPVVGSIDLEPLAWHWTWDHNGGPQVNARFRKLTSRNMEGPDWAAWMAVKMIVQAALRTKSADFKTQRDFILGGASFDGDKGLAMSIRPWDHQLRQAILLATPYYVSASAPVEGFWHQTNVLDTLGDDQAQSPCRLNR
jgi:ABC transporter substrate binding protein (PQQ-dependent alcohol dehydrogenase system)